MLVLVCSIIIYHLFQTPCHKNGFSYTVWKAPYLFWRTGVPRENFRKEDEGRVFHLGCAKVVQYFIKFNSKPGTSINPFSILIISWLLPTFHFSLSSNKKPWLITMLRLFQVYKSPKKNDIIYKQSLIHYEYKILFDTICLY